MQLQVTATVIGGHGFIGSHLVRRLRATGWNCQVTARDDTRVADTNMGHVFYCAGLTADYASRPYDTVEAHVSLLGKMLREGCFESLVYLSSTRLYDSQPGRDAFEDGALVLDPANPRHIFDLSKALGESLCRVAGDGRARVARLSCVYKDHTDEDGFLPDLLRRVMAHSCGSNIASFALKVDSSLKYARDYIDMDDVLDALILIATCGKDFIYNVASGENISNGLLFDTISRATGHRIVALRDDEGIHLPIISIRKMHAEFGWEPARVLDRVVRLLGRNADVESG